MGDRSLDKINPILHSLLKYVLTGLKQVVVVCLALASIQATPRNAYGPQARPFQMAEHQVYNEAASVNKAQKVIDFE